MKHVLKLGAALSFIALVGLQSCEEVKSIDEAMVYQYRDTIPSIIPGISSWEADVKRDFNTEAYTVKLIIHDAGYYTTSPEKMQEAAIKAGQMALIVFGKDKNFGKGMLIATKEPNNSGEKDPADAIKFDMKLDSLKEASNK